jgi:hypothetical protein
MTTLVDDFERADGGLGSNWEVQRGSAAITSGKAKGTSGSGITARAVGSFAVAYQSARAVLDVAASSVNGVIVYSEGTGATDQYRLLADTTINRLQLERVVGQSPTILSFIGATLGSTEDLELVGRFFSDRIELTCYRNGSLITGIGTSGTYTDTDAARLTTGKPGLYWSDSSAGGVATFTGTDVNPGAAVPYIRDRLVSKFGLVQANVTGITMTIWRAAAGPTTALPGPDQVIQGVSTDANGYLNQVIAAGSMSSGDKVWMMLHKAGSPDLATARRVTPIWQ